jgi:hypothetical protein
MLANPIDHMVDTGSYIWTAQPLGGLSITNGFHFTLARSAAVEANNSTAHDSFDSGLEPLYIIDESTTTASAPVGSQISHVTDFIVFIYLDRSR